MRKEIRDGTFGRIGEREARVFEREGVDGSCEAQCHLSVSTHE